MRELGLCVVLLAVGCIETSDPDSTPGSGSGSDVAAIDPSLARACDGSRVLVGFGSPMPQSFYTSSVAYDTAGQFYCFELDARQNLQEAHLMAGTEQEPRAASSFQLALFDFNNTMLREGWDVSAGNTDTTAFANLEYSVTKGDYAVVKLFVGTKAGTVTTSLHVSLFEPYE